MKKKAGSSISQISHLCCRNTLKGINHKSVADQRWLNISIQNSHYSQTDSMDVMVLAVTCRSSLCIPGIGFVCGKQKHVGSCAATKFSQRDCWNHCVEALITYRWATKSQHLGWYSGYVMQHLWRDILSPKPGSQNQAHHIYKIEITHEQLKTCGTSSLRSWNAHRMWKETPWWPFKASYSCSERPNLESVLSSDIFALTQKMEMGKHQVLPTVHPTVLRQDQVFLMPNYW